MTAEMDGHETAPGWDTEQADALLRDITAVLDLDAGLRDILAHDQSNRLLRDITAVLDLDAGLQDILPVTIGQPATTHEPAAGAFAAADHDDLDEFIRRLSRFEPVQRLMIRQNLQGTDLALDLRHAGTVLERLTGYRDRVRELLTHLHPDTTTTELTAGLAHEAIEMQVILHALARHAEGTQAVVWPKSGRHFKVEIGPVMFGRLADDDDDVAVTAIPTATASAIDRARAANDALAAANDALAAANDAFPAAEAADVTRRNRQPSTWSRLWKFSAKAREARADQEAAAEARDVARARFAEASAILEAPTALTVAAEARAARARAATEIDTAPAERHEQNEDAAAQTEAATPFMTISFGLSPLIALTKELTQAGELEQAEATARSITDPLEQSSALHALAEAWEQAGDQQRSADLVASAETVLYLMTSNSNAGSQAQRGQIDDEDEEDPRGPTCEPAPALRQALDVAHLLLVDIQFANDLLESGSEGMTSALNRLSAACERGSVLVALAAAINDYHGADLRAADLGQILSLDGIRWTTSTRWPQGVKEGIEVQSDYLGGGVYEIREGTGVHQLT
jgi:hypothetical protein